MTKSVTPIPANDSFGALAALSLALDGGPAALMTEAEVNGVPPTLTDPPTEVADHIALILESSGSTGTPKRVSLSAAALIASARATEDRLGGPGQWLLALPIRFIGGAQVLVRSIVADTQPVMMNTQLPFTVEAFVRGAALLDGPRRYTALVPTQLVRIAEVVDQDPYLFSMLRRFDAILVGGQRADFAVVQKLRALGINLVISYGMTETAGGCVYDGIPLEGVEVRLVEGLIEISGPTLAEGCGPWFATRDLGDWVDDRLEVLGRSDRVFASGGIKVSLDRIEAVCTRIAGVQQAVAVALPDREWGERAAIAYVGSPEVEIETELVAQISQAAKPVRVLRVVELPQLQSGKPDLLAVARLFAD
jgi:O-succinylbenzoic acid--CoA ligase